MKTRILILTILLLALTIGCQENGPLEQFESEKSISKEQPNWVKLPEPIEKSLNKSFKEGKWIDAGRGGKIRTRAEYLYINWSTWSIKYKMKAVATIEFPANTWDVNEFGEGKYISLEIDDETATSTFDPHLTFNQPAIYNATFTGLDFSSINTDNIDFVYQAPDGTIERIVRDELNIDLESGTLQIVNAKIPHFSRYGFTN